MLRSVVISAVYPPETVVSGRISQQLAGRLREAGLATTVICPQPSRPLGADYRQYQDGGGPLVRCEDGLEVVRLPSLAAPQSQLLARMRESWSFGRATCRYLCRLAGQVDVVYANAWPLLSQALIARYCAAREVPLVLHVQDIYPESLANKLPRSVYRVVAPMLLALDRWIVERAARVVVISENMRRIYAETRRVPAGKLVVVENWQDERLFESLPDRAWACRQYNIAPEPFTFMYLGNIGPVAGVEMLIHAFAKAQLPQAQLIIAGGGTRKAACEELVRRLNLNNIQFVFDAEIHNVPRLQSMAHICLLPMQRGAGMSSIPSKLPAYLFSAKPVLAAVDVESDTAQAIREADCGWIGQPENVKALAERMRQVAKLPKGVLEVMGQRGREYALKHYSRAKGVELLASVVLGAARGRQTAGTVASARPEPAALTPA